MSKVVSKVLGGGQKAEKVTMPVIKEPTVMPEADDAAIAKARAAEIARQQARSGRQSTMLSADDKLGG